MKQIENWFKIVFQEIGVPDSSPRDWFRWAAGQLAHAMIGAALAGALLFFLSHLAAFLVSISIYTLGKEIPDYLHAPGWSTARDCVQDALFTTAGAAIAIAIAGTIGWLFILAVIASSLGLAIGIYQRSIKK